MRVPVHHLGGLLPALPRAVFGSGLRLVVLAASLTMGIGAVGGAYELLHDAGSFGMKEAWLEGSPFPDYKLPGLFLGVVIGGGMLSVAVLTWLRHELAPLAAVALGETLVVWLTLETAIIGFRGGQQITMLVLCFVCALVLIVAGYEAMRDVRSRRV